ncbi:MAG: hypothetical protein ACKO9Z_14500 [Planctomycetota bacterium]
MGYTAEPFLEEKASQRIMGNGAPAKDIPGQLLEILGWIKASQAQLESVFSGWRAMACPHVAPTNIQRGNHFMTKTDRNRLFEILHHQGHFHTRFPGGSHQLAHAVGERCDKSSFVDARK